MKKHHFILPGFFHAIILLIGLVLFSAEFSYAIILRDNNTPARDLVSPELTTNTKILKQYGNIPLHFEANKGQTDQKVKFLCRGHGHSLFLTDNRVCW